MLFAPFQLVGAGGRLSFFPCTELEMHTVGPPGPAEPRVTSRNAGWARSGAWSPLEAGGRALDSLDCGRCGQINDAGGRAVPAELWLLGGGRRGEERRWSPAAARPGQR